MSEDQAYFFAILTIGSFMHLLREKILSPAGSKRDHKADRSRTLSPVEAAYLSSEGDSGFALVILLFDILHREVKDKITGGEVELVNKSQKAYELALRKAAGGSIKEWGMRKLDTVAGSISKIESAVVAGHRDPLRLVFRIPAIYKLIRTTVESVVQGVLRDPRNIKRLVSVPGLLRLAAEIGATGYKTTLTEQLKEQLTDSGYLASDETRLHTVKVLIAAYGLCQVALLGLILLTIPSQWHAFLIYICALFAAFVVHACTGAREFIPLYSDLGRALAQVKHSNIRIDIIRAILGMVTIALNILAVIVFMMLFGFGSLFLYSTHTVTSFITYLMLIGEMLVQLVAITYLVEAYRFSVGEMPTGPAKHQLAELRREYKQKHTLTALKSMLTENYYSQELSYLIALYGLETLLLI